MRLTAIDGTWHIIDSTKTSGDAGYQVTTACGIEDHPWDQTFIDQMPSGGLGGSCDDCQVAVGAKEKKKSKK